MRYLRWLIRLPILAISLILFSSGAFATDNEIWSIAPKATDLLSFRDKDGNTVGSMDIKNGAVIFTGNVEESAKIFFTHYSHLCGCRDDRVEKWLP